MSMQNDVDESRRCLEALKSHPPSAISVMAIGVKSKAPYKLLCARESLFWRTEEMGRCAFVALDKSDLAAGVLLVRAVTENAAIMWRLKDLTESRTDIDLNAKLDVILLGWKNEPNFPKAFNIQTMIDHMDKKIPGFRARYNGLSEFAHPNWSGTFGLFGKTDYENYETYFGRNLSDQTSVKKMAYSMLASSLILFEHAYNCLADIIPSYVDELESIWIDD